MRLNSNLLDSEGGGVGGQSGNQGSSSGSKRINKCSIKFEMPKEKAVQLVREDGQMQVLKLVK